MIRERRPTGRRYCREGHDKRAPHGAYPDGRCAVCARALNLRRYYERYRKA